MGKEVSDLTLFVADAARGLTWLHRGDFVVIHRDLKPENLLVDENYRVKVGFIIFFCSFFEFLVFKKVCDFGLSQVKGNLPLHVCSCVPPPR